MVHRLSRFCSECGKEYPQGNVCLHCGASVGEGDAFCQNCGKSINITQSGESVAYEEEPSKSGFKKYLPYILGAIVLLAVIGCFSSRSRSGSLSQGETADSLAVSNELPIGDKNTVIADYDESKVYSGEYVFDAVFTDAALEKSSTTMTMIIDGDNVSFPSDEFTMKGDIDSELKIEAYYDYGDGLHFQWVSFTPNSKDGTEWKGELQTNAFHFDVVMKLKEVKRKGDAVKITKERKSDDESNEADDSSYNESSSNNSNADINSILNECQSKITSIQREIESTCRTFGTLASDNNIDLMKYGRMKITFINGVNDLLNQANNAFDKCARDLQQAGVSDAVSAVNQEKRQFNRAINELKSRTIQQAEMSY